MFLRSLSVPARPGAEYPLSVEAVRRLGTLRFAPGATVLMGENGCGKTTIMELLADGLAAVRVGNNRLTDKARAVRAGSKGVRVIRDRTPLRCFYFSAEDFIKYIDWVEASRQEARREIARIDQEADPNSLAATLAKMPHSRTLGELDALYEHSLNSRSHGEGFLDFFRSRLGPSGLYLLDEPEGALSCLNQYALALIIRDALEDGCQFVLSTHSPILAAIPGAQIYEIGDWGARRTEYEELENVQFLKLFLQRRERMFQPFQE